MPRISNSLIRQQQIRAQEQASSAKKGVVRQNASASNKSQISSAPRNDSMLKATNVAKQETVQAPNGMSDTSPSANPFEALAKLLVNQRLTGSIRPLADGLDRSIDIAPDNELALSINDLEQATSGMPEGDAKTALSKAMGKLRQGTLLNTSDAKETLMRKGPMPDAEFIENLGGEIANLKLNRGDSLLKKKLANLKQQIQNQGGAFPVGTDINAFVQAVLRESYLLQNEILENQAKRVKFYNAQKRKIREKQEKTRALMAKGKRGDLLSDILDGEEFELEAFDAETPFVWVNPEPVPAGEDNSSTRDASETTPDNKGKSPENVQQDQNPSDESVTKDIAPVLDAEETPLPDISGLFSPSTLEPVLGLEGSIQELVDKARDAETWSDREEVVRELLKNKDKIDLPALVNDQNIRSLGYPIMWIATRRNVENSDLDFAKSFIATMSGAQAAEFYARFEGTTANTDTGDLWRLLDRELPDLKNKARSFDAAFDALGFWAQLPAMKKLSTLLANVLQNPKDLRSLNALKVALAQAPRNTVREFLGALVQENPGVAQSLGGDLLFGTGEYLLKGESARDWAFMAGLGEKAGMLYAAWEGIEYIDDSFSTDIVDTDSSIDTLGMGVPPMQRVERAMPTNSEYERQWYELNKTIRDQDTWKKQQKVFSKWYNSTGADNVLKHMVRFGSSASRTLIGRMLVGLSTDKDAADELRSIPFRSMLREYIRRMTPQQAEEFAQGLGQLKTQRPQAAELIQERAQSDDDAVAALGSWSKALVYEGIVPKLVSLSAADLNEVTLTNLRADMWGLSSGELKTLLQGMAIDQPALFDKIGGQLLRASKPSALAQQRPAAWVFLEEGIDPKSFLDEWVTLSGLDSSEAASLVGETEQEATTVRTAEGAGDSDVDETKDETTVLNDSPPRFSKLEAERYLNFLDNRLKTVGEDAALANLDLQGALQKQQQMMQMMSNISKMLHDTAMSIIRKIGG